jgi:hypothetical protein
VDGRRCPGFWTLWVGSTLLAAIVGLLGPLRGDAGAQGRGLLAACADWSQGESLENQARKAAAAGDPQQYGLWKDAATVAQRCEAAAGNDAREWFAYLHADDSFMSLGSEAEILAGAPTILAEFDRLVQTAKQPDVQQAAAVLRNDVARSYRYTRESVRARVVPVLTPEPTISPILLLGGGRGS